MRITKLFTKLAILMLVLWSTTGKAQDFYSPVPYTHVFDIDSLKGFDEDIAKQAAFQSGAFGDEFKVAMYYAKRDFIKAKYNIHSRVIVPFENVNYKASSLTTTACVNEDFEQGALTNPVPSTINITTMAGVNGWTVTAGSNTAANGSCGLTGCCPSNPSVAQVISTNSVTGGVDNIIGASYPIFSVFGNNLNNGGVSANPFPCYGDWFMKLNDQSGGNGIHRIAKTINVTPANAVFQFAFISVVQGAHCCCENGSMSLKTKDCLGNILSCPQFTAASPAPSGCTPTGTCGSTGGSAPVFLPCAAAGWNYNKWKVNTMDLTAYIGSCITIEVTATDCIYGGHAGYVYFDAQCLPMAILGNNTLFPAGTPQITLPTCGAGATATVCAPPGLGPYQWVGPTGFVPTTAQCFTTGITGNYTLTMTPPGACSPTVRQVSVVISPAPNLAVSGATQVSCTSSLNAISLTMASGTPISSVTPNYIVSVSPSMPTGTTGVAAATGTYTGLAPGVNTITITDAVGCINTVTINMLAAAPVPQFSLSAPSGTLVGCAPPTIPLVANNTGTVTPLSYTWTSISTGTATGSTINGSAPTGTNSYVVFAQGPGSCLVTQTINVAQNTSVPGLTVNPTTRTITCNGAPACFTAICSPTTNVQGQWFDGSATALGGLSNSPILMCTGVPGTYSVVITNITNGCVAIQTVAVAANTIVPTMTVNSLSGNTITCNQPCLVYNITASTGPAPKSYSWTNVTTSVTTSPATGGYTICVPGNYVAQYQDGNLCRISQTITVMIDTLRPTPLSITDLPSNSYTLSCYNPSLVATGYSNPLLSATNYSWTIPPNLTIASNTISINTISVTSNPTTFTVLAKGNNGCVGRQKVNFYEDLLVPPYTAVFTPSAISCTNPNVAMSPNSTSTSTIPVTFTFTSPPPTTTANASGSLFGTPGTYTMTYQNTVNGCQAVTQTVVPINVTPPSTVVIAPVSIPCGATTVGVNAGTSTQPSYYTYTWTPPTGAGMSCASCYTSSVNMPGEYEVVITNTINGCINTNVINVGSGSLTVAFTPDPSEGFAPLSVSFANNTALGSGLGSGSITTTWSYGNGTSYSVTNSNAGGSPNGATIYQSAGSYTVLLVVQQSIYTGTTITANCVGTATAVVKVELPSDIIIPNIFTPNGDGSNDVFTIQNTNLTNVTCQIFDRWGVKMYDVTSEKGQIGWDGKNLGGKEVPSGTYFYMLKATGKDGVPYDKKGTVSLYR